MNESESRVSEMAKELGGLVDVVDGEWEHLLSP